MEDNKENADGTHSTRTETITVSGEKAMEAFVSTLFEKAALRSHEKQIQLQNYAASFPEGWDWNFDTSTCQLTLHDQIFAPVMMAGSASYNSNTWLWADANPGLVNTCTPGGLVKTREIRAWGKERVGMLFLQDQVPMGPDIQHGHIAYIYTHLADASFHWNMPNGPTAYFVLAVNSDQIGSMPGLTAQNFATHWESFQQAFPEIPGRPVEF